MWLSNSLRGLEDANSSDTAEGANGLSLLAAD